MYVPVHGIGDVSALATDHIVLGLLVRQPGYGYDLVKRTQQRFSFLGLSENYVYRVLDRLERAGLIERIGAKRFGATARGAPRVMYQVTKSGRRRFKEWMATPSDRDVLSDELQLKLNLSEPDDLPALLTVAETQAAECITELSTMRRPVLAQVTEPEVPWEDAAVMMTDDLNLRLLQGLVDWLNAACEVIEGRIARSAQASQHGLR
jgi:DNA-binding PadR family transcriptional regulator